MTKLMLILMVGVFLTTQTTICQNAPGDSIKMKLKDRIDSVGLCPSFSSAEKDRHIYLIEEPAIFPNGDLSDFRDFIQDCVNDSFNGLTGKDSRVFIRFVIDTDGSLVDPDVLRCNNPNLARAALECLKKSPKWTPAKQCGRNVKQLFTIPIVGRGK
jgi:hypothetical protein